jgi:membrane protease YdiL (CAAX protease family)
MATISAMTNLPPPLGPPLAAAQPPVPAARATELSVRPSLAPPAAPHPTLPIASAIGAIVVLTGSLTASKFVLDALVGLEWPVIVYVSMLALIGYGPSVWWCWYASRRWASGHLGPDIGLTPRWSDIGWGPVVWLGAIGMQLALAAIVIGFGIPITNNTDGITELQADRTYVISIVLTAVIAAPLVEEMVFRGVVMRGLHSRMPAVLAIVLQAVLFGAAHIDPVRGVGNVGLFMVLSGVGLAFGIAAYLFRRIGPTIVAHAIFNTVILVLLLTGVADRLQDSDLGDQVLSAGERVAVVNQPDLTE